jgi:hypothetical protein
MNQLETTWSPADHTATWPTNPAYPGGETIDEQSGAPRSCLAMLRYPAPCCGTWSIHCPGLPQDGRGHGRRPG